MGPLLLVGGAAIVAFILSKCATTRNSVQDQAIEGLMSGQKKPEWLDDRNDNFVVGKSSCVTIERDTFIDVGNNMKDVDEVYWSGVSHALDLFQDKIRQQVLPEAISDILLQKCGKGAKGSVPEDIEGWTSACWSGLGYLEPCSVGGEKGIQIYLKAEKTDIKCE